jgi:putative effector of murein hydrolase
MYSWNHGQKSGILFSQEANSRTAELYPYLTGDNYKVLVFRPLYMNGIYMSVLCIAFVLLFFGYQYMKDPPQGAYIEKIMFLLLVFSSMEIFHAWAAVKTIEWKTFSDLWWMGHYVSVFLHLLISVFFALRLRFITSVKGEFYEQELVTSPTAITRWRDTLDNLVIEKFFNRKLLLGRMLVDPSDK